jgi:hypothetical protein
LVALGWVDPSLCPDKTRALRCADSS